jgi:uncharacterized protein (TIGR02466 family)
MNTDLTVQSYFATPMGFGYNVELAQKYLPIVERLLADPESSNPEYFPEGVTTHCTNVMLAELPEFKEMRDWIYEAGCEFMAQCGFRHDYLKNEVFIIANSLGLGGHHKSHTHYDCTLSGVLYLTSPEGASAVEFEDPVGERLLHKYPIADPNNPLTWEFIYTRPEVGLFNIFPPWFRHTVLPNKSTEPRIAVAFNIG